MQVTRLSLHHHNTEVLECHHGHYLAKGMGFILWQFYRSLLATDRKSKKNILMFMAKNSLLQYSELLKVHIFLWKQKKKNPSLLHPTYIYVMSNAITLDINIPH